MFGRNKTIIRPEKAAALIQEGTAFVLDVRTPEEYAEAHLKGAVLIPDYELPQRVGELPADKNAVILVYCRSGRRSAGAVRFLRERGYAKAFNMGGLASLPFEKEG